MLLYGIIIPNLPCEYTCICCIPILFKYIYIYFYQTACSSHRRVCFQKKASGSTLT